MRFPKINFIYTVLIFSLITVSSFAQPVNNKVKSRAAGGSQLRDDLFVVGQRDLDLDPGFLFELRDDFGRHVIGPGDDAQLLGIVGAGGHAQAEPGHQHYREDRLHHSVSPRPR